MIHNRRQRVLIVGPYPPPDTGVTMPFKLFCDWMTTHGGDAYDVRIVRTHTDRKPLVRVFDPVVLWQLIKVILAIPFHSLWASRIVIFGSNRFVSLVGGTMALLTWPLGKPVSLRIFGGAYELYYQSRPAVVRWLIRRFFAFCDRVVAEPRLSAEALRAIWPEQIRGVRNYRVPLADAPPRAFDPARVRFVYTGNVRGVKGCGELLAAFADVRKRLVEQHRDIHVTLDFYGPIQPGSDPVAGLEDARQDEDITFHGAVANATLMAAYRQADVFVYPTYWPTEGHSGAVIEALCCGLPVLASDWRANSEVVHDGVNGLLCQAKDATSLADAMLRLAVDVDLRRRLSDGALREAAQYDAAVVCPELADALGL